MQSAGVNQPIAWEVKRELREFVDVRPNMQREEWEYRFSNFWKNRFSELAQPEARRDMFETLSLQGYVQRRYASELDHLIANNAGWKARIADLRFVCCAFPVCNVGVCHHQSIGRRKGYEDKNGRVVSPHTVRPYFSHRGQISDQQNQAHQEARNQLHHDQAIDDMVGHLLRNKSGFYIIDRCPDCQNAYEALRVSESKEAIPKYRDLNEHGALKFEYDIGVLGENEQLIAILEAFHTHEMGESKRQEAASRNLPWIEYSVPAMLSKQWKGAVHSAHGGWLSLDAVSLKIGHSGAPRCSKCSLVAEKKQAEAEKRQRARQRVIESQESLRRVFDEVIFPLARDLEQYIPAVELLDPGFSRKGLNRMEAQLSKYEFKAIEIQDQLSTAKKIINQLNVDVLEAGDILPREEIKSICLKTGLNLDVDGHDDTVDEMDAPRRQLEQIEENFRILQGLISDKQRALEEMKSHWGSTEPE